jgi:hypothetical protein
VIAQRVLDGRFERSRIEKFNVNAVDIGALTKLRIGHGTSLQAHKPEIGVVFVDRCLWSHVIWRRRFWHCVWLVSRSRRRSSRTGNFLFCSHFFDQMRLFRLAMSGRSRPTDGSIRTKRMAK